MDSFELKRKSDWIGLKVESLQEIRCGIADAPIGTIFLVTHNYGGLHLTRDRCPECDCRFYVRGVKESHVHVRWDLTTVEAYNLERSSRDSKLETRPADGPPGEPEIVPSIRLQQVGSYADFAFPGCSALHLVLEMLDSLGSREVDAPGGAASIWVRYGDGHAKLPGP